MKQILNIGLGASKNPLYYFLVSSINNTIAAETARAKDLGYNIQTVNVSLEADEETTIGVVRQALVAKQSETHDAGGFACVNVGFGVRGNSNFTRIFERCVNLVIEEGGSVRETVVEGRVVREKMVPKMCFAVKPSDLVNAIVRVMGE